MKSKHTWCLQPLGRFWRMPDSTSASSTLTQMHCRPESTLYLKVHHLQRTRTSRIQAQRWEGAEATLGGTEGAGDSVEPVHWSTTHWVRGDSCSSEGPHPHKAKHCQSSRPILRPYWIPSSGSHSLQNLPAGALPSKDWLGRTTTCRPTVGMEYTEHQFAVPVYSLMLSWWCSRRTSQCYSLWVLWCFSESICRSGVSAPWD